MTHCSVKSSMSKPADFYAGEIREELGILNSSAIDFDYVFSSLDIRFVTAQLIGGVLGACKVEGLHKLIVVSSDVEPLSRKRFTMAHELGHIVLHHGASQCKNNDIFGDRTQSGRETEANRFAAAFLLPPAIAKRTANDDGISFNSAKNLADLYGVSLTSTLISLVKNSTDSICLFIQKEGKIERAIPSPECILKPLKGKLFDRVGIGAVGQENIYQKQLCNYESWFSRQDESSSFKCSEETRYFTQLKTAISIVNVWEEV